MHVSDICTRSVVTCLGDASAVELARMMRDHHVGDIVVVEACEGGMRPVGIVTDRDLVVRVMAQGLPPADYRAADLMNTELVTAVGSETAYDAIWHMRSQGIRRLPVVDAHNRLIGIVTADDIGDFLGQELAALARVAPRQIQREQIRQGA